MMRRGNEPASTFLIILCLLCLFAAGFVIWTVATTLLAAITTTQQIMSGENHQAVFEVIVLTFDQLYSLDVVLHRSLENKARAGPSCPARRAEATLEILLSKQIIHGTKETQFPLFPTERQ